MRLKNERIERRGTDPVEMRLARLEVAIDDMAAELQRVTEGQQFVTKLLAEEIPRGGTADMGGPDALAAVFVFASLSAMVVGVAHYWYKSRVAKFSAAESQAVE